MSCFVPVTLVDISNNWNRGQERAAEPRDRINVIARRKSGTVRGEEGGESVTFVPFLVCEERLSRVREEVQLIDDS